MSLNRSETVARVTIDAGDSLFAAGLAHAMMADVDKVNHIFPDLFALQDRIREGWEWGPVNQLVFIAAVDLSSDRQGGLLQKAGEAGAIIDPVDYRDYYPGPLPGGPTGLTPAVVNKFGPSDSSEDSSLSGQPRPRPSLSPRINFLLGGIAGRLKQSGTTRASRAEVLVVAHHFEIKDSLMELSRRGARVGLAFYRSLMEPRWERFGLYDSERSPIKFYDLGPHLDEITTLGQRRRPIEVEAPRSAAAQLF